MAAIDQTAAAVSATGLVMLGSLPVRDRLFERPRISWDDFDSFAANDSHIFNPAAAFDANQLTA